MLALLEWWEWLGRGCVLLPDTLARIGDNRRYGHGVSSVPALVVDIPHHARQTLR